jgi:hypothetical protein
MRPSLANMPAATTNGCGSRSAKHDGDFAAALHLLSEGPRTAAAAGVEPLAEWSTIWALPALSFGGRSGHDDGILAAVVRASERMGFGTISSPRRPSAAFTPSPQVGAFASPPAASPSPGGRLECRLCKKKFSSRATLDTHLASAKHKKAAAAQRARAGGEAVDRSNPPRRSATDIALKPGGPEPEAQGEEQSAAGLMAKAARYCADAEKAKPRQVYHYITQPLVELCGGCMVVLKVS